MLLRRSALIGVVVITGLGREIRGKKIECGGSAAAHRGKALPYRKSCSCDLAARLSLAVLFIYGPAPESRNQD
jgi:hypothetical protein